jgi:hypothetical protein
MKTTEALFHQYGKKFVPASDVIKEYWGYELVETGDITKMIAKNKLNGLKPIRIGRKYIVDIENLAVVLDSLRN